MSEASDRDRLLFEQAVAAMESASPSKLARVKGGGAASPVGGDDDLRRSRRLDKLRKSARPEATIDLHGLDRKIAVAQVKAFLRQHGTKELLLIVHGKGRGILQQRVCRFLDQEPAVAEHIAAPQRLGGAGARLVRLRRARRR